MSTVALLTLEDYDHMIESGTFDPPNHRRCELIQGEIRDMSPIGPEHGEMIDILDDWSHDVKRQHPMRVRIQSSIGIPEMASAPEPDVVWAVAKSYAKRRPEPSEVLLVIEVAQSTLRYDLGEKVGIYAEAGITDYWVVDIPNRLIHVHRDPTDGEYHSVDQFAESDEIGPLTLPHAKLNVGELFSSLN